DDRIHFCKSAVGSDNSRTRITTICAEHAEKRIGRRGGKAKWTGALEHRNRRKTREALIDGIDDETGRLERGGAQKRRNVIGTEQDAPGGDFAQELDLNEREIVLAPAAVRALIARTADWLD